MVVRGSASYRLAAKLKEMKQNLKIWNKEVFGRLECNKAATLQQVELWDLVERERSLTEEEAICKKGSQGGIRKVGVHGRNPLETAIKGIMAKGRGYKYELFPSYGNCSSKS